MRSTPHFYVWFGRKWLLVAYFAYNAHITLCTGAECYGTSADDRNTNSGSMENEYSTSVIGSTFLPSPNFWIVDLHDQMAVFAVSIKPEVVVSPPEVVLRDRKWLPAQIQRLRSC